jgi:hypothetical protein
MVVHQKGPPVTITITIEAYSGADARKQMADLFGGPAMVVKAGALSAEAIKDLVNAGPGEIITTAEKRDTFVIPDGHEAVVDEDGRATGETRPIVETAPAPTRQRGQPSPGRSRRTKAEIAEDDAAEASDVAARDAISETPEDRQDPNNPEPTDSEADAQQDAADEAAETAAATGGALTLDSVRNVSGLYAKKFGVAAAQEDIREFIGKPMIELVEGEYEAAIAKISHAVETNPKGRDVVGAETDAAPKVEKKDLINVLLAYALKFDGQNTSTKPEDTPLTLEDAQKCFQMRFGDGIEKLSDLKPEQYQQALKDLQSMLAKNPFGREVKVAS